MAKIGQKISRLEHYIESLFWKKSERVVPAATGTFLVADMDDELPGIAYYDGKAWWSLDCGGLMPDPDGGDCQYIKRAMWEKVRAPMLWCEWPEGPSVLE